MNESTENQYYYLEKPIYILLSAVLETYVVFKFIPVEDVAFEGFHSKPMYLISLWVTITGLYLMIKAKSDQCETPQDTYGFGFIQVLSRNGNEFPL